MSIKYHLKVHSRLLAIASQSGASLLPPQNRHSAVSNSIVKCAVPAPLFEALDYSYSPNGPGEPVQPGIRVRVPLGQRSVVGVVLATSTESEHSGKLRAITEALDACPLIDEKLLTLLQWAAHYYVYPLGEVVMSALSPRERRGEPPASTGIPGIELNQRGKGLPEHALRRAPKQALCLRLLQAGAQSFDALEQAGVSRAVVRELMAKDLVMACDIKRPSLLHLTPNLPPTKEQATAIAAINRSHGQFACHLLHGITGSGKTEVYLQCIAQVVARGQQALVLVPEIGLTPQMIQRFEARFGHVIAVLHSGLADSERDRHWAMARDGSAAIVIGTRSAVFAPLYNPGIIIVDEEHDPSFQQQDGFRYSGRDTAVKRAQLLGCPIVLGSATPSLESWHNTVHGRYQLHTLHERAGGALEPSKTVIDIRGIDTHGGLSPTLLQAARETLAQGLQVLLFLNRRGFAPALMCHDCGWVAGCSHCDARLTLHRQPPSLRCHHCSDRRGLPLTCPQCGSRRLVSEGMGTEQTEMALRTLLPDTRIIRADSDSMTTRHAMTHLAQELEIGQPCVVLGTQLITKGHHFPKVTCVGVIDADGLLFSPDFRGEERLLQLLTQVAGRAGRATLPGRVFIQTRHPEHPIIQQVLEQPYGDLANQLLEARVSALMPPVGALAIMRCDSRQLKQGLEFLASVAENYRPQRCRIIGPLPAAMARRAGLFRSHLVIHGAKRSLVLQAARELAKRAMSSKRPQGLRWAMDVDPAESA